MPFPSAPARPEHIPDPEITLRVRVFMLPSFWGELSHMIQKPVRCACREPKTSTTRDLVRHIWKKQQEKNWPRLQRIWRRFRFTEMLTGWLPILRRSCDCFRHGISRKLTDYGVQRLSIIAARQRDSGSRTDPGNVKPVIWQHASAGRSLPQAIGGSNIIKGRRAMFRKRETSYSMTGYSRTKSTTI